jgi:eukaryotic-like serine/threonine-protein kinase
MTKIGAYRVLNRVGSDARAELFVAVPDASFAERVLLRVTPAAAFDKESARAEFIMTVKRYATLSHSSLVQAYNVFTEEGSVVVVLEYVEGVPLDELMRALAEDGRALPDAAAMFIGLRIAGALAASHAARDPQTSTLSPIAHGDVRPESILVPWDGFVRLAEYKAAKCAPLFRKHAAPPSRHASPELAREGRASAPGDVYSAALVLWELLGKRQAFPVSLQGPELLAAMVSPNLTKLRQLRPDLPERLTDMVDQALEPRTALRTVSAAQLLTVLRTSFQPEDGETWLAETMGGLRARLRPEPAPVSSHDVGSPIESTGPIGLLQWAEADVFGIPASKSRQAAIQATATAAVAVVPKKLPPKPPSVTTRVAVPTIARPSPLKQPVAVKVPSPEPPPAVAAPAIVQAPPSERKTPLMTEPPFVLSDMPVSADASGASKPLTDLMSALQTPAPALSREVSAAVEQGPAPSSAKPVNVAVMLETLPSIKPQGLALPPHVEANVQPNLRSDKREPTRARSRVPVLVVLFGLLAGGAFALVRTAQGRVVLAASGISLPRAWVTPVAVAPAVQQPVLPAPLPVLAVASSEPSVVCAAGDCSDSIGGAKHFRGAYGRCKARARRDIRGRA